MTDVSLTIYFTGLVLFTNPGPKPAYSTAVMVTGDGWQQELHSPVLKIDKSDITEIRVNGERSEVKSISHALKHSTLVRVVEDGGNAAPTQEKSFTDYLPSVTAALDGAKVKDHQIAPCVLAGDSSKCNFQSGFVRMVGGKLEAMRAQDEDYYYFWLENGRGDYGSYMTHQAYWTGKANSISLIEGSETTVVSLRNGARVLVENEPFQLGAYRHFGVFRHLWGMTNNGSLEGFPLSYRKNLVAATKAAGSMVDETEALRQVIAIVSIPRPIFCPPARQ